MSNSTETTKEMSAGEFLIGEFNPDGNKDVNLIKNHSMYIINILEEKEKITIEDINTRLTYDKELHMKLDSIKHAQQLVLSAQMHAVKVLFL